LGWRSSAGLAIAAVAALILCFHQASLGDGSAVHKALQSGTSLRLPRRFWGFWTVMLLGSSAEWCMIFWGATFFEHTVKFEKATAAAIMSAFFGATVIGRFVASRLAQRMESSTLLLLSQGITLIGFPLFWLASSDLLHVAGLFWVGFGMGNFYPMALATAVGTAPHLPERASARLSLAMGLAGLFAPVTLGWLADQMTIQQAYAIVLPILIAAGVLTASGKGGLQGAKR
jgi:fucose permease